MHTELCHEGSSLFIQAMLLRREVSASIRSDNRLITEACARHAHKLVEHAALAVDVELTLGMRRRSLRFARMTTTKLAAAVESARVDEHISDAARERVRERIRLCQREISAATLDESEVVDVRGTEQPPATVGDLPVAASEVEASAAPAESCDPAELPEQIACESKLLDAPLPGCDSTPAACSELSAFDAGCPSSPAVEREPGVNDSGSLITRLSSSSPGMEAVSSELGAVRVTAVVDAGDPDSAETPSRSGSSAKRSESN